MNTSGDIRLREEGDWWVAIAEDVGVASQGETREQALENLDEAVVLHEEEAGEPAAGEIGVPDAPWFDES